MTQIGTYLFLLVALYSSTWKSSGKIYPNNHGRSLKWKSYSMTGKLRSFIGHSPDTFSRKDVSSYKSSHRKIENGTKKDILKPLNDQFPENERKEVISAYAEVVGTFFDITENNEILKAKSFLEVLRKAKENVNDLFEAMEKKMEVFKDSMHKPSVKGEKEFINNLIETKDSLDKTKWIKLRDMKKKFLPQYVNPDVYSTDFLSDMATYFVVYVGVTGDMILKADVDQCQLSREADLVKYEIESSVQALIYKRLSMLEPSKNSWGIISYDKLNWKDTYDDDKPLCPGSGCVLNDGSGNPVQVEIEKIGQSVLEDSKILFETVDGILKLISNDNDMCFDDCDCPEEKDAKIERSKYIKDFPWGCRGENNRKKNKNKNLECVLPCGKYGESYDWCPTELAKTRSSWDYCNPANWNTCAIGWY